MKIGTRVANLMNFSWISLRLDFISFSFSVSALASAFVGFASSAFAFLSSFALLMIVAMSLLSERKPSIVSKARIAAHTSSTPQRNHSPPAQGKPCAFRRRCTS